MGLLASDVRKKLEALNAVKAAWLAALIDGEGTVGIVRQSRPENVSGFRYYPYIEVNNSNLRLLAVVQSVMGGALKSKNRKAPANHKPVFSVIVRGVVCSEILAPLIPVLIVKDRQAQIVTKFCSLVAASPEQNFGQSEQFERLWLECRELNRRGI
jgi:hypothetical protein